jgi:hypothetical protein
MRVILRFRNLPCKNVNLTLNAASGAMHRPLIFHMLLASMHHTVVNAFQVKIKLKVTLVQALRLCTGRTAHRRSRGIALLFHDHGTRSGWGVSVTPRPLLTPGKDPAPIVQEAGWAPGPVWTGAENLSSTAIRSPDRPVRNPSLFWLSYPACKRIYGYYKFETTPSPAVDGI